MRAQKPSRGMTLPQPAATYPVTEQALPTVREAKRSVLLWTVMASGLNALDRDVTSLDAETLWPFIAAPPTALRAMQRHGDVKLDALPFMPALVHYYERLLALRPRLQGLRGRPTSALKAELFVLRPTIGGVTEAAHALVWDLRLAAISDPAEDHRTVIAGLDELLAQVAKAGSPCVRERAIVMPPWAKGRHSVRRRLDAAGRLTVAGGRFPCVVRDISETSLGLVTDAHLEPDQHVSITLDNGRCLDGTVKHAREEGRSAIKLAKRLAQDDPLIHV